MGKIIMGSIAIFFFLQGSIWTIGNRSYSLWYSCHHLVKRKGLCKLIYFKPKFFHRYALDEVIFFFSSYAALILGAVLTTLIQCNILSSHIGQNIIMIPGLFFFVYEVIRIFFVIEYTQLMEKDIFSKHLDLENLEKYPFSEEMKDLIHQQYVVGNLEHILEKTYKYRFSKIKKEDIAAIEKLDDEYIAYYKNAKHLMLV